MPKDDGKETTTIKDANKEAAGKATVTEGSEQACGPQQSQAESMITDRIGRLEQIVRSFGLIVPTPEQAAEQQEWARQRERDAEKQRKEEEKAAREEQELIEKNAAEDEERRQQEEKKRSTAVATR